MVGALLSSAILTFSCSDDDAPTYSEMAVDKTDIFIQADGEHPTAECLVQSITVAVVVPFFSPLIMTRVPSRVAVAIFSSATVIL